MFLFTHRVRPHTVKAHILLLANLLIFGVSGIGGMLNHVGIPNLPGFHGLLTQVAEADEPALGDSAEPASETTSDPVSKTVETNDNGAASVLEEDLAPGEESINRFRIESVVTMREYGKPDAVKIQTTTLFGKNTVIDFIGDNDEIIIYNRLKKNFTLLDPIHRIQTELTVGDIDIFLGNLKRNISGKKDTFYKFILQPEFNISRNNEAGELMFQSKWYEYTITTRSFDDQYLCDDFFEFSEVYSKLNIYLNPGTFTPFARMKVNETLEKEKRFPVHMELAYYPGGKHLFARALEIKSDHKIIRRLSEEDRGRVIRASHFAQQFPKMLFGNYYRIVTGKE